MQRYVTVQANAFDANNGHTISPISPISSVMCKISRLSKENRISYTLNSKLTSLFSYSLEKFIGWRFVKCLIERCHIANVKYTICCTIRMRHLRFWREKQKFITYKSNNNLIRTKVKLMKTSRQNGVFHTLLQCIQGNVLAIDLIMKIVGYAIITL